MCRDSVKFSERSISLMVKDLTSGLFHLHSRQIVHRDVKPENIMVRTIKTQEDVALL